MKRIRIDFYHYRLRKGHVSILLSRVHDSDEYALPSEYVRSESRIQDLARSCHIEDDGDLVLNVTTLNESHLNGKREEWVSIDKLANIKIRDNESFRISRRVLKHFLHLCPKDGESGIFRKVNGMLETVKIDIARKDYIDMLNHAIDGVLPEFLGASILLPDTSAVKRELESLEHFHLVETNHISMNQCDSYLLDNDLYSYTVDWEALGFVITPFPLPASIVPIVDHIKEL